jgi:erythromycin esterase
MANLFAPIVQEQPAMIASPLLLPLLLPLVLLVCPQDVSTNERVAWLTEHAKPLTSLDLHAEDDSDLEPLKRAVEGRRIVLLGEQSHGDGETFRAKARLVRFLHEQCGFDLLVWEAGFFECAEAWSAAVAGTPLPESAAGAIQAVWTRSAQVQAVLGYVQSTLDTDHPLRLAGMDMMPTGALMMQAAAEVEAVAVELGVASGTIDAGLDVLRLQANGRFGEAMAFDDARQETVAAAIAELRQALLDAIGPDLRPDQRDRARLLAQHLDSHRTAMRMLWTADFSNPEGDPAFNLRDEQMAANLLWLAAEHPDERILVWGATSHLSRNRQRLDVTTAPGMIPMGHHLHEALGDEVYSIAFTAYDGTSGTANPGSTPFELPPVPDGSLEALWHATGQQLAFLDLAGRDGSGAWLDEPLSARPMGYGDFTGPWPEVVDAFVYIQTMTPSTP